MERAADRSAYPDAQGSAAPDPRRIARAGAPRPGRRSRWRGRADLRRGQPRRGRARRRVRAGKRAGKSRGQAVHLCRARQAGAAARAAGAPRPRPSPPRASPKTLPGRARCLVGHPVNPPHLVPLVELCGAPWTSPEAIDRARNDLSRDRAGAGHDQPRDQRLCAEPAAGRAAGRSLSPRRRRLYLGGRSRSHREGRPRPALVVPRAVRDHRTQRARRHPRLLRALYRLLQGAGCRRRRPRGLPKPECRPGDRGVAASADAGTHRSADAAAQRTPRRAGRAQGRARQTNPDHINPQEREQNHEPQSHHHLRRDRRDPHPLDVEGPAGDAAGNRRRRGRRRRGRRRDRASARAQSRRPASPTRARKPSRRS